MGAIDLVEGGWANMRKKRFDLEKKAREDINREMEQYAESLADAVYRAVKIEKNSIAEVSRRMGASRPTVYELVAKGEARTARGAAIGQLGVAHPYDEFLRWEGDAIVVDWPGWLDPATTEWERKFGGHTPGHLKGKVIKQNGAWTAIEDDEHEALQRTLDASRPGFRDALNEWSGK